MLMAMTTIVIAAVYAAWCPGCSMVQTQRRLDAARPKHAEKTYVRVPERNQYTGSCDFDRNRDSTIIEVIPSI